MTSSDLWTAETAERYDESSAFMFRPEVLDPTVDRLAELAGGGRVLELAVGTGRVAIPLAERGVEVSGIELSQPMVDRSHAKRPDLPVVVGDLATATARPTSRSGACHSSGPSGCSRHPRGVAGTATAAPSSPRCRMRTMLRVGHR